MNLKIKGMCVNVLMSFIHIILNLEKKKPKFINRQMNEQKRMCVCACTHARARTRTRAMVYYAAVDH